METEKDFFDVFSTEHYSRPKWDKLLEQGWDRVGTEFFRIRWANVDKLFGFIPIFNERMPLRYRLEGMSFTSSQRKNLRINDDLTVRCAPSKITDAKLELFERWHNFRFGTTQPLDTWVQENVPFRTQEVSVFYKKKLIACSFFDKTPHNQYSTIACFEPEEAHRSLGTFTLLQEIRHGMEQQKTFHYPGHAFYEPYMYEYKKKFRNLEYFDWNEEAWKVWHKDVPCHDRNLPW